MNRISINGVVISGDLVAGSSVQICNGKVIVNGKDVTPDSKNINISIEGDVDTLKVDCCNKIVVTGDANNIQTGSGNVYCGEVTGPVQTGSGDIECMNVQGDIRTGSGDVDCGKVSGRITTGSGDVIHKEQ